MLNVINGGAHADNPLDLQEFMLVPYGAVDASARRCASGAEVFHALKSAAARARPATAVGDEGGFAPRPGRHEEAIELILEAIEAPGYTPGEEVGIALDPRDQRALPRRRYHLDGEGRVLDSAELVDF